MGGRSPLPSAVCRLVEDQELGVAEQGAREAEALAHPERVAEGVHWLRGLLRSFAAGGKTVLVSSHVLAEVAQTVDQVVIINKGRLVTISPLAELTTRVTGAARVRAPRAEKLRRTLMEAGIEATLLENSELSVRGDKRGHR